MKDERVFIGDLTRKEFRERMQAGTIQAAIVPTGATEQHNEHLEMIHDILHCAHMAEQAARRLLPRVVVASPISIGVSEHWMEHIGTLTVRPEIFCEYVFDVCRSLQRAGVANILILNGHGGNVKPLMRRIDEYRDKLKINLRFQSYWDVYDPELVQQTMELGRLPGHAGEYETSTMYVLGPGKGSHRRYRRRGWSPGNSRERRAPDRAGDRRSGPDPGTDDRRRDSRLSAKDLRT